MPQKLPKIIGMCILLVLVGGCMNSYQSCQKDCIKFCNNEECGEGCFKPIINERFRTNEKCYEKCYNECKPK